MAYYKNNIIICKIWNNRQSTKTSIFKKYQETYKNIGDFTKSITINLLTISIKSTKEISTYKLINCLIITITLTIQKIYGTFWDLVSTI